MTPRCHFSRPVTYSLKKRSAYLPRPANASALPTGKRGRTYNILTRNIPDVPYIVKRNFARIFRKKLNSGTGGRGRQKRNTQLPLDRRTQESFPHHTSTCAKPLDRTGTPLPRPGTSLYSRARRECNEKADEERERGASWLRYQTVGTDKVGRASRLPLSNAAPADFMSVERWFCSRADALPIAPPPTLCRWSGGFLFVCEPETATKREGVNGRRKIYGEKRRGSITAPQT